MDTGKDIKLKRCPFCGGMAIMNGADQTGGAWVSCLLCGATQSEYVDERTAAAFWNLRTHVFPKRRLLPGQRIYRKWGEGRQ